MINKFMINSLYLYDNTIQLLYHNGIVSCECISTDNRPMHNRIIKLHKGVDNEVKFKVVNPDRKPVPITHLNVIATLTSSDTKEVVLVKQCYVREIERGQFVLVVDESDLFNISPGFYSLGITGQEMFIPGISESFSRDILSTPFYTDTASNSSLVVEVTEQLEKSPIPTNIADSFTTEMSRDLVYTYNFSKPFPANRVKNFRSGLHTLAVYAENFTGKLEVLGSLDQIPPSNNDMWFTVNLKFLNNEVNYVDFTGVDPFSFRANLLWLKIKWYKDPTVLDNGSITKIMLRS